MAERKRPAAGVQYHHRKGALLGPGSGIKTAEQARRVVAALRGKREQMDHHQHCTCVYSTECCDCPERKF